MKKADILGRRYLPFLFTIGCLFLENLRFFQTCTCIREKRVDPLESTLFIIFDFTAKVYRIFAIEMISAKTPAAVTSAPAPYPLMIIGYSWYLSVEIMMMLLLPSSS